MQFDSPLTRGTFVRRYKRFFVDVDLADGTTAIAHCANTGSMLGLMQPGFGAYLSASPNPAAKLNWRLEMIETPTSLVGVNTSRPNALVAEAIEHGHLPALAGYTTVQREVKYGQNSRIDLLLSQHADGRTPACYVEVKNTTLREETAHGPAAAFPDAVTARGLKHLEELVHMVAQGHRAAMVYAVNRADCTFVKPAIDIDPAYAAALARAHASGVEVYALAAELSAEGIPLKTLLPVHLTA